VNELAELEQAERIKGWCREYGVGIMLGVILAMVVSVGWHYWWQASENKVVNAAIEYENLLAATMKKNNLVAVESISKRLLENYPQTPYASLAALQVVKQAVNQNNLPEAENKLVWIIQHGKSESLRAVASIRLARVLLAENQPERALKMLDKNDNGLYQPLILEQKGDILSYLGNFSAALQHYLVAEKLFSASAIDRPLLSMKINNLIKSN
jgi:predicted negative regulator of RcsB-dependent stress response